MLLGYDVGTPAQCRVPTDVQCEKHAVSALCNEARLGCRPQSALRRFPKHFFG